MKKYYKFFTGMLGMLMLASGIVHAQIPADQQIVVIEPGMATLETVINGDVDTAGARINPHRIYMLKKDGVYMMNSRILFGGSIKDDSTATLTIIGEEGGKKPIVLLSTIDDLPAKSNVINGSLNLKNVFWNATAINGTGNTVFEFKGSNRDLRLEGVVVDGSRYGAIAKMNESPGESTIIIKNCYFRDLSKFNQWNNSVYFKKIGDPIDTLWVENTSVVNGGLIFLGKSCPTKFAYFNHNTIVNTPKYAIINEQFKEAYFTNNIFINCNWQGEDLNMQLGQLQSQIDFGPHNAGIVNIMEPKKDVWAIYGDADTALTKEDMKVLISNNLHFTSPYLNKYYNGEFNTTASTPLSNIDWGKLPAGTLKPMPVTNVPPVFLNSVTEGLIASLDGVKEADNHVNVDPLTKTKGIADQSVGIEFAHWARIDYGVADVGETFDPLKIAMGDMDPSTVPGVEVEDGDGISKITDFVEDFSYDADIVSTIDGLPLGALHWWNGLIESYNKDLAMANVKDYYLDPANHTILTSVKKQMLNNGQISIYPNPAKNSIQLGSKFELNKATIYDATGRFVKQINLDGSFNSVLNISDLDNGLFLIQVETKDGNYSISKFIKQ